MSQKRVLRRMFGPKMGEALGGQRRLFTKCKIAYIEGR
jgi:hypothetical protein